MGLVRWLLLLVLTGCSWPEPPPRAVPCVMIVTGAYSSAKGKVDVSVQKRIVGWGVLEKGGIRCWQDVPSM